MTISVDKYVYSVSTVFRRIHVLFMMYDVYWYRQMKKNEWLWKFWKRNDLYENFEKKGGVVEKRGEEEAKSMPHAPVLLVSSNFTYTYTYTHLSIQAEVDTI